jgi:hypothetical protein
VQPLAYLELIFHLSLKKVVSSTYREKCEASREPSKPKLLEYLRVSLECYWCGWLDLFELELKACYSLSLLSPRWPDIRLGDLLWWSSCWEGSKWDSWFESRRFEVEKWSITKSWWLFGAPTWTRRPWQQPRKKDWLSFAYLLILALLFICVQGLWVTTRIAR